MHITAFGPCRCLLIPLLRLAPRRSGALPRVFIDAVTTSAHIVSASEVVIVPFIGSLSALTIPRQRPPGPMSNSINVAAAAHQPNWNSISALASFTMPSRTILAMAACCNTQSMALTTTSTPGHASVNIA